VRRTLVLLSLLFLHFAASTPAFDGKRKGLVLGGGFGLSPFAHWSTTYSGQDFRENSIGLGDNLIIGYGVDERNLFALDANIVAYRSELIELDIIQGFGGISWYHYYGAQGKSFFSVAGMGLYRLVTSLGGRIYICFNCPETVHPPLDQATGIGYLVGGGYEFARHIQIALYLAGGKPSERGLNYGSTHVALALTAVAF
jgi:hypothetical protein